MGLVATIAIFVLARSLQIRLRAAWASPVLVSMLVLAAVLLAWGIPYPSYAATADWLTRLLEPSVVALAIPLYKQLPTLRKNARRLLVVGALAAVGSMLTSVLVGLAFRASRSVTLSLLPKSVTTPIAIAISAQVGGTPSLTVVAVLVAGLVGAAMGPTLLSSAGVLSAPARGLAIGAGSHALGTARIGEEGETAQAHSSVALVLCGLFTAVLAPLGAKLVDLLWP